MIGTYSGKDFNEQTGIYTKEIEKHTHTHKHVIQLYRFLIALVTLLASSSHLALEFPTVAEPASDSLAGCLGFNGPLRKCYNLYRTVSQIEGERGKKR